MKNIPIKEPCGGTTFFDKYHSIKNDVLHWICTYPNTSYTEGIEGIQTTLTPMGQMFSK